MLGARAASLGLEMEHPSDEHAAYPAIAETFLAPAEAASRPGGAAPARATAGTLTIAAVPIGQPADASARLAPALEAARLIAAEDTRRLRRLAGSARRAGHRAGRVVLRRRGNPPDARLAGRAGAGQDVLLVTDAGMPGVSDPGYRLVAAAAAAGIRVTVLPGPSAVTAALVISGLPCDRFVFEGFPPRRAGESVPEIRRARRRAPDAGLLRVTPAAVPPPSPSCLVRSASPAGPPSAAS